MQLSLLNPDLSRLRQMMLDGPLSFHSDDADACVKSVMDRVAGLGHVANEWADCSCNALQYLKNIADGVSSPKEAIENIEKNIAHCREVAAQVKP